MIFFLALRNSFSRTGNHRARAIRIALATALSLATLMVTISVMEYLQTGRFDKIRASSSFDITLSGDFSKEMKERFPSATVFSYGETEVLGDGNIFTLRYIDDEYDGELSVRITGDGVLLVPYTSYSYSEDSMSITMMREGRSGMMIPVTADYDILGTFSTPLDISADSSMLFLPLSEISDGVPLFTAIKGCDGAAIEDLRADGYTGTSWKEKEAGLYSAFMAEKLMMYIVLSLLFIIILVSLKQSVRIFFDTRKKERAELVVLGLDEWKADAAFTLSIAIITLTGIGAGFVLSCLFIPAGEIYASTILGGKPSLTLSSFSFILFSSLMLLFTVLFSFQETGMLRHVPVSEVLSDE